MKALVVVLDDEFPVGRELVVVGVADNEVFQRVVAHDVFQLAQVLRERRSVAGDVHEHKPVPLFDARGLKTKVGASRDVGLVTRGDAV